MSERYVKPSIRRTVAELALKICEEEQLDTSSLSKCIEAIIHEFDKLRLLRKVLQSFSKS